MLTKSWENINEFVSSRIFPHYTTCYDTQYE